MEKAQRIRTAKRHAKVNRSPVTTAFLFLFVLILGLFMVVPLVLIVSNSFKPLNELWIFPPKLFPMHPTTDNYRDMITVMSDSVVPFTRYLFNTVLITVSGTAGHIILASMAAFPLAKKKFRGRDLIFNTIVFSLMFTPAVTSIPTYMVMSTLGWIDSYTQLPCTIARTVEPRRDTEQAYRRFLQLYPFYLFTFKFRCSLLYRGW